ncbi:hypothetical protein [Parasphingorhabdus sp.]|uniref:hypothetical protein n=1 Tax=Parasphingorhabdus sp. TaxID=2709688 RepID=UPI0030023F56
MPFREQGAEGGRRIVVASALAMLLCSPAGGAESTTGSGGGSAMTQARAVIRDGIELRQEGGTLSPAPAMTAALQVNVVPCDPEMRKIRADCVLLVYEIQ